MGRYAQGEGVKGVSPSPHKAQKYNFCKALETPTRSLEPRQEWHSNIDESKAGSCLASFLMNSLGTRVVATQTSMRYLVLPRKAQ